MGKDIVKIGRGVRINTTIPISQEYMETKLLEEYANIIFNDIQFFLFPYLKGICDCINGTPGIMYEKVDSPFSHYTYYRIYDGQTNGTFTVYASIHVSFANTIICWWFWPNNMTPVFVFFSKHFFKRLDERYYDGKGGMEIYNSFFYETRELMFLPYTISPDSAAVYAEWGDGLILGKQIAPDVYLAKTFVSSEMLKEQQLPLLEPSEDAEDIG